MCVSHVYVCSVLSVFTASLNTESEMESSSSILEALVSIPQIEDVGLPFLGNAFDIPKRRFCVSKVIRRQNSSRI